jgi:hypothetical protein
MGNCIPSYSIRTISRRNTNLQSVLPEESKRIIILHFELSNHNLNNKIMNTKLLTNRLSNLKFTVDEHLLILDEVSEDVFKVFIEKESKLKLIFSNNNEHKFCFVDLAITKENVDNIVNLIMNCIFN